MQGYHLYFLDTTHWFCGLFDRDDFIRIRCNRSADMKGIDGRHIVSGSQAHRKTRHLLRRWYILYRLFQEGLHELNFFVALEECGFGKYLQAEVVADHELPLRVIQYFQGTKGNVAVALKC